MSQCTEGHSNCVTYTFNSSAFWVYRKEHSKHKMALLILLVRNLDLITFIKVIFVFKAKQKKTLLNLPCRC